MPESQHKAMPKPSDRSSGQVALGGALAAIAALATGQFVSSLDPDGPTLIDAVGSGFIDRFAATLKDIAVALFGVHHKTALITGVWVVGATLGAISANARRAVTAAVWSIAAVTGLWAHSTRPESSTVVGIAAVGLAAITGAGVMWLFNRRPNETANDEQHIAPGAGAGDRRQFISLAVGTLAGSAALVALGRTLHQRTPTVARVLGIPAPDSSVPVPTDTGLELDGLNTTGLTDYITPASDFYRIDTALRVPRVDPATWKLSINGMVKTPLTIDYASLLAEESVSTPVTIACVSNQVGGPLVGTAVWQGVPLARLLERCGVYPTATQIVGHSIDGFTAGMPTAVALDGRTCLVAYAMNGDVLPEEHGFPVRLIVSGLYGYVSATKWLTRIELTVMEATDGYWIERGWAKEAPVKISSRIDVPGRDDIEAGLNPIAGVAWSPSIGISAVEVSIDEGPWIPAELGRVANDDTWVQWLVRWDATPGTHTIAVRATDIDGKVQTDTVTGIAPDGATGHHRRRVTVR